MMFFKKATKKWRYFQNTAARRQKLALPSLPFSIFFIRSPAKKK